VNVARILYPVESLGPGKRIGIWLCGCPRRCDGCSNPELWEPDSRYEISTDNILKLINGISEKYHIDGFTITGGDPFFQPEALDVLTEQLIKISDDILIYTGYEVEELRATNNSNINGALNRTAVLIDGKYIKERNHGYVLRGSDNQRIHILSEKLRSRYEEYLNSPSRIQNFPSDSGVISVGIHRAEFARKG